MEYFRKKPNQNQGVPFSLFRGASVAERNLSGGCFGKEGHGRRAGEVARHERSRAGLSKISFLCRLPELPNVGRPQLPLPTTKRRCPDGYRLLVVGRVHIAETPEGSPRQSGAAREEQGRVEQNFFPVPLARTAERRQTSITSSRNTKGDAPMGIAFWWWEGYILPKPLKGPPRQSGAAREEQGRIACPNYRTSADLNYLFP